MHLRPRHKKNLPAFTLIELLTVIAIIGILAAIIIPVVGRVRDSAKQVKSTANLRALGQAVALFLSDNKDRFPGHADANTRPLLRIALYSGEDPGKILDRQIGSESVRAMENGYRVSFFRYPGIQPEKYTKGDAAFESELLGTYGLNFYLIYHGSGGTGPWGAPLSQIREPSRTILAGERYSEATAFFYLREFPYFQGADERALASNIGIKRNGIPKTAAGIRGPAGVLFVDLHVKNVELSTLQPFPNREGDNPQMFLRID